MAQIFNNTSLAISTSLEPNLENASNSFYYVDISDLLKLLTTSLATRAQFFGESSHFRSKSSYVELVAIQPCRLPTTLAGRMELVCEVVDINRPKLNQHTCLTSTHA